jgi:hypothetical protein
MNEEQVVELMKSSKSEDEWDANTRKVKGAFNGQYPYFWYKAIIASGVATQMASSSGSSSDIQVTAMSRKPIANLHGRPTSMPLLRKEEKVVGVYDQGLGEKDMFCETLADMQKLYDSYASGMALTLKWFIVSSSTTSIPI